MTKGREACIAALLTIGYQIEETEQDIKEAEREMLSELNHPVNGFSDYDLIIRVAETAAAAKKQLLMLREESKMLVEVKKAVEEDTKTA